MTVDHQVAHSVYLNDPDGNSMEYYCDTVNDWRTILHGEMELITSGWDPDAPDAKEPSTDPRYDENPEIRTVDNAPVHPQRVTHAVLVTQNLEQLVEFYTSVGGLTEVDRGAGVAYLRGRLSHYPLPFGDLREAKQRRRRVPSRVLRARFRGRGGGGGKSARESRHPDRA